MVDGAGSAVAEYVYTPFGELLLSSGDYAAENPFRFSSEYYDSDLGLVYYNYRYYNPGLGRWLSRDPIGFSGGLNLYAMVGNNPVNLFDLLGLDPAQFLFGSGMFAGSTGEQGQVIALALQGRYEDIALQSAWRAEAALENYRSSSFGTLLANYSEARSANESIFSAVGYASVLSLNPCGGLWEGVAGEVLVDPRYRGQRLSPEERWWRGALSFVDLVSVSYGLNSFQFRAAVTREAVIPDPLQGTILRPKVVKQIAMPNTEIFHKFPVLIDTQAKYGIVSEIVGGDGVKRTRIQLPGAINGTEGFYSWIIEPDNTINHRFFERIKRNE